MAPIYVVTDKLSEKDGKVFQDIDAARQYILDNNLTEATHALIQMTPKPKNIVLSFNRENPRVVVISSPGNPDDVAVLGAMAIGR